jgi:aminocarboxymuconate-semialdehyde decarboxylase
VASQNNSWVAGPPARPWHSKKEEAVPNRREFVRTVAGAAVGLAVADRAWAANDQRGDQPAAGKRREVSIGNRRVKIVDIHCHCIIPEVAEVVKGTPFADSTRGGGGNILGPQRLEIMDRQGVDIQALSTNGYWWYGADRDLARRIVQAQNDGMAKWVAAHPDRFVAFASVALQFPDLAAEQLERAVKEQGMKGVSIGGHVKGQNLSQPAYDPFWAKAAELGALVVMHPQGGTNIIRDGALEGPGDLGNIIGNPLETTVFLSRLIFEGTLDKFPGLRIFGPHAGGYLPSYLGRTDVTCDVRANANCANKKRPREYFKREIFIDTLVFSEEGLRHLVAEVGASQVLYGTDVPFNWPVTIDLVLNAPFLTSADKEAILGGNAAKLLRLTA